MFKFSFALAFVALMALVGYSAGSPVPADAAVFRNAPLLKPLAISLPRQLPQPEDNEVEEEPEDDDEENQEVIKIIIEEVPDDLEDGLDEDNGEAEPPLLGEDAEEYIKGADEE